MAQGLGFGCGSVLYGIVLTGGAIAGVVCGKAASEAAVAAVLGVRVVAAGRRSGSLWEVESHEKNLCN